MKLSAFTIAYQLEKIGVPFELCIQHHLDLADEYIVLDLGSIDGTWEKLNDHFGREKTVKLYRLDEPITAINRHWLNKGKDMAYRFTTGDWALINDLDEYIHERDFQHIRKLIERYDGQNVIFGFDYAHFIGSYRTRIVGNYFKWKQILFPRHEILSTKGHLDGGTFFPEDGSRYEYIDSGVVVYHYWQLWEYANKHEGPNSFWKDRLKKDYCRYIRHDGYYPKPVRENPQRFICDDFECLKYVKTAPKQLPNMNAKGYEDRPPKENQG